MSGGVILW